MIDTENEIVGYIKFFGPAVDEGTIDVEKAGKSLIAFGKLFQTYLKDTPEFSERNIVVKVAGINKNCTEIIVNFAEHAIPIFGVKSLLFTVGAIGIVKFTEGFFKVFAEQSALKLFGKGKPLVEKKQFVKNQEIYVLVIDCDGNEKEIPFDLWDKRKLYSSTINEFIQLEAGKITKQDIGYYSGEKSVNVASVEQSQKHYFDFDEEKSFEERQQEDFDESKAEPVRIVGKFMNYHTKAHKYHFAFEARKEQNKFGKQYILCIVDQKEISRILDYLKPDSVKSNLVIIGKGIKDIEGKMDKVKIDYISEDENFNPDQMSIPEILDKKKEVNLED